MSPPRAVNMGLHDIAAVAVNTGDRQPITHPSTSILPSLGSTGRCERWKPSGVSATVSSSAFESSTWTAPMARSLATAFRVASTGGGSNASPSVRAGCVSGRIASARITRVSKGAVCISGRS